MISLSAEVFDEAAYRHGLSNDFHEALAKGDQPKARALLTSYTVADELQKRGGQNPHVPNLLPGCIEIVRKWEARFRSRFERITCVDDEYILHWQDQVPHSRGLRVRYFNTGYHETTLPLYEALTEYVETHNLVLDCLERYRTGKYYLRLRYPSGEPAAYFEHQEVIVRY